MCLTRTHQARVRNEHRRHSGGGGWLPRLRMKRRKTLSMTRQEDDMNGNGLEKRYRANGNYVYREIAGEGVLVP